MGILEDYFLTPMGHYYTWLGTLVYGIIFAIAVFGVYKLLQKLKVAIDRRFVIGIFPFIVLGSLFRVIKDANIVESLLFTSPLIYLVVFAIALVSLVVSIGIERLIINKFGKRIDLSERKKDYEKEIRQIGQRVIHREKCDSCNASYLRFFSSYHRLWALIGIALCIGSLLLLIPVGFKNFYADGLILGITAMWVVVVYVLYRFRMKIASGKMKIVKSASQISYYIEKSLRDFLMIFTKENSALLSVHLFDASTTFVALSFFPYYEQHVVSNVAIGFFGPVAQFLLKWVVLLAVLWVLDKYLAEKENVYLRSFIKVAILILGFSPGFRNFLRLGFMV